MQSLGLQVISSLKKDHSLFPYLYNLKEFDPGSDTVYYAGPYWNDEEPAAMIDSVLSGKWLAAGEKVHKFEIEFSKKFNQSHSVMVNSGSSANLVLISSLKKVLKWKDGDEIILSPVGFPTTIAPVVQNNLTPVFVDIEFDTLNFDLDLIEEKITPQTKAIFISPVLGNSPDFDKLLHLKGKHGIELVLDNCDSLGSKWKGKYLNEYAIASSCSFYPAHHICTGEGGMVSSNDPEIIKTARSFSCWGRDCYCVGSANLLPCGTCGTRFDRWLENYDEIIDHKFIFSNMGYNLKPLDLQGAVGLKQLKKFREMEGKRKANHSTLKACLEDSSDFRTATELSGADTNWFGFPIICSTKELKQSLVKHFESHRIQTRNYFAGNILLHPAYSHLGSYSDYPNANQVLDKVFFIGCSPTLSIAMINYIKKSINEFLTSNLFLK